MIEVVTIPFTAAEVELCKRFAANSALGVSHVRHDDEERLEAYSIDLLTGMLGNLAGCKWLLGLALGHYAFRVTQHDFWHRRGGRSIGDGGSDIVGCNLDFKSCEWSLEGARPLEQVFLPVRPQERHEGWIYVLVLVEPDHSEAHLVGWARDRELGEVNGQGVFEGAHTLISGALHPLPPFRWEV